MRADGHARGELQARIDLLARVRLAHLPTPLDPAPRLTEALEGPEIWIKRDDMTGLAFGGNKTRQLEEARLQLDHLYLAGANMAPAGLALGLKALRRRVQIHNIAPIPWSEPREVDIARIANPSAERRGLHSGLSRARSTTMTTISARAPAW
jgi:hypothetical protein